MKKTIALLFLLPLHLFGQTTDEAIAYNDKIVGLQNNIIEKILAFNENLEREDATKESQNMYLNDLKKVAAASLKEIGTYKAFYGNTELRDAGKALFQFYNDLINATYTEMIEIVFKDEITDADFERLNTILEKVTAEEAVYDDRFQRAQEAFAKKYNLELEENEYQKEIDKE